MASAAARGLVIVDRHVEKNGGGSIIKKGDSPVPLFVVYLSCACVGTLLACFLRHVDDVEPEDEKVVQIVRVMPKWDCLV